MTSVYIYMQNSEIQCHIVCNISEGVADILQHPVAYILPVSLCDEGQLVLKSILSVSSS